LGNKSFNQKSRIYQGNLKREKTLRGFYACFWVYCPF
jgi:hypothetical protein